MTIDVGRHQTILFQILKDIYQDQSLAPFLGFKGGTAAQIFYGLDRFSVDLDFDLLEENEQNHVFTRLLEIVPKYGQLKDSSIKRHSLFCLLSYQEKGHNIKIEVNRRSFQSRYEIKNYLGISTLVMVKEDMFAHKLVAMSERMGKTSRDIYDIWFFLAHHFPLNHRLVEQRVGTTFNVFLDNCISKLEKLPNRHILDGVGELLTAGQKDWARNKLKSEVIALLILRKI